jgi:hypothetical protein
LKVLQYLVAPRRRVADLHRKPVCNFLVALRIDLAGQ